MHPLYALWWLAGLAVAATIGVALNVQQVAAGNLAPDRWAGMSLLAMIALGIAGGWAGWIAATRDDEVDRALEPRLKGLLGRQHRWLDLFATEDFVPAGPLLAVADYREVGGLWTAPQTATLASARVVNQRNPLKDHTTYWANPEGFVDPVLAWIANLYGIGWLPAPAPAKGWRARPERMSLRYAITVILLLLVLALCWRAAPIWRAMVPSADWLAGWFLEKLGYTGPRLTGLSGGFAATVYDGVTFMVAMGLHVAALSVYESMVTGPLWRSFDRQLTLDPPRDASGWAKAIGRLGLYLLVAGLTVVALVEAAVAGNYRPLLQVPADLLLKLHAFLF